jgi:hypothetical protein
MVGMIKLVVWFVWLKHGPIRAVKLVAHPEQQAGKVGSKLYAQCIVQKQMLDTQRGLKNETALRRL